jgi:hypothetical protein
VRCLQHVAVLADRRQAQSFRSNWTSKLTLSIFEPKYCKAYSVLFLKTKQESSWPHHIAL